MFQKMLQGGGGGDNNLDIENATFLGGYYQEEGTRAGAGYAKAWIINTNSDLTEVFQTYTSEYFNIANYTYYNCN